MVIVVTFHRLFITRSDRYFRAKCFFAERKSVMAGGLEVATMEPREFLSYREAAACKYAIYNASFEMVEQNRYLGPPLTYAKVGDRILHAWTCPDGKNEIMCIRPGQCSVLGRGWLEDRRDIGQGSCDKAMGFRAGTDGNDGSVFTRWGVMRVGRGC